MSISRIIPILLLKDKGLVKTTKFKNPKYIGDPINALKIFNDKVKGEIKFESEPGNGTDVYIKFYK